MADYDYDLFVIRAGSGGVRAARLTALDASALSGVTSEDAAIVDAYVRDLLRAADGELAAPLLGSEDDVP